MLVTLEWMKKNYDEFNNLYFNGELPKIEFKISRSRKTWGFASYKYDYTNDTIIPVSITLSNYYESPECVKQNTLLHEMIHILDYTKNPHHYIKNKRPVSRRKYDAHGFWFLNECERLKGYGWEIAKHVTSDEVKQSSLSATAKRAVERKQKNSLVVVINGTRYSWMLKTDTKNIYTVLNNIRFTRWERTIGTVKSVKCYKFDNENLAASRNVSRSLRGWKYDKNGLTARLKYIKATEIHDYNTSTSVLIDMMYAA